MKKIILASALALAVYCGHAIAAPQDFNITWNSVAGSIQKYQLKTRIDNDTPTTVDISTGTSTTVNKNITSGQTLYAQVRACDATWCGDWSNEVSFVMPSKPGTPSIIGIQLIFAN